MATDEEQLFPQGEQRAAGPTLKVKVALILGVAVGVMGISALIGGHANLSMRAVGSQFRTVQFDASDTMKEAFTTYVKLENLGDWIEAKNGYGPLTLAPDAGKTCLQRQWKDQSYVDNQNFLADAWKMSADGENIILKGVLDQTQVLTDNNNEGEAVVFDGEFLFVKGNPKKVVCCEWGEPFTFKEFELEEQPPPKCHWRLNQVVGPTNLEGRPVPDAYTPTAMDDDDDGDDDRDF